MSNDFDKVRVVSIEVGKKWIMVLLVTPLAFQLQNHIKHGLIGEKVSSQARRGMMMKGIVNNTITIGACDKPTLLKCLLPFQMMMKWIQIFVRSAVKNGYLPLLSQYESQTDIVNVLMGEPYRMPDRLIERLIRIADLASILSTMYDCTRAFILVTSKWQKMLLYCVWCQCCIRRLLFG